jgi:hypothetical protein
MVKMKKLIFLILLFFILNAIKLYCYYYPYPILMVHGRGDTAQFWNYHGAMPGFRQYMYQYFPLNNEEYHIPIKKITGWEYDNIEKPLYSYSLSNLYQRAEGWIEEIYHRQFGNLIGKIYTNETYYDTQKGKNEVRNKMIYETYDKLYTYNMETTLCWPEAAKRNFLCQHVPPQINVNEAITVNIQINNNKEVTGAIYSQNGNSYTWTIANDLPFLNKFIIVAHSTGGPVSRGYITDKEKYRGDVSKLVTIGGVNAGSNWAKTVNLVHLMIDKAYLAPLMMAVGTGLSFINPALGGQLFTSGWLYAAVLGILKGTQYYPIDDDLKADSDFVKKDLDGGKPEDVKYRVVVGKGYEVPTNIHLEVLIHEIGTLPFFGVPGLIPLGVSLLDFFIFHFGWPQGDGVLTINEQRGIRDIYVPVFSSPINMAFPEKINKEIYNAKYVKVHGSHADVPWLWGRDLDPEDEPGNDFEHYKALLKMIDDPSSLAVENSNTLTAVKMEPDGCYVNIQKPKIHIDGSCDDYLIQWMGDNDRIRLRYDKYANVDEVVHLKNTEEGVFDYQRVGDVGRGWFSQNKNKRKGV